MSDQPQLLPKPSMQKVILLQPSAQQQSGGQQVYLLQPNSQPQIAFIPVVQAEQNHPKQMTVLSKMQPASAAPHIQPMETMDAGRAQPQLQNAPPGGGAQQRITLGTARMQAFFDHPYVPRSLLPDSPNEKNIQTPENSILVKGLESLNKAKTKGNSLCDKTNEMTRRVFAFTTVLAAALGDEYKELKDPYFLTELATGISKKCIKNAVEVTVAPSKVIKPLPRCTAKERLPQSAEEKGKRLLAKYPPEFIEALRWAVHDDYLHGKKVVVAELKKKLMDEFPELQADLSKTSLWRVLRAAGFRFQKISDRMFVYEDSYLTNLRHSYLGKVTQYRKENAFLVFMDETWLFEGMRPRSGWVNTHAVENPLEYLEKDMRLGPTPCPSKGKRAIVLGAICEEGIIPSSFQVVLDGGDAEDGDYHKKMNGEKFHAWFMATAPEIVQMAGNRRPVLILDNASYHNMIAEKLPTKSSSKTEIIQYLNDNNVRCSHLDSKIQLTYMLDTFYRTKGGRAVLKKYTVDGLAEQFGIEILRLPPRHCILNPIEKYWGFLKAKIGKYTTGKEKLEELRNKTIDIINEVTPQTHRNFFDNALHEEQEFIRKEGLTFVDSNDMFDYDGGSDEEYY